jgi:hypothetical protein
MKLEVFGGLGVFWVFLEGGLFDYVTLNFF